VLAHKNPELEGWRFYIFMLYATLVVFSFIFLIQNFVLHQYEKSRIQLELLELKASNSEAVNQLLQQQIQPHFLFNALNILKSLIRKDSKSAEAYLLRLSDFLRVSISNNKSGVATIEDELKVCDDYMEMQRIRFGDALQYKVDIKPNDLVLERKLPFFSLQPLLENAIKHNELTNENPLYIKIEKEGNCIKVSNNIQIKKYLEVSTGNGHNMLKERYKILDAPAPVIKTEGQIYSVSLQILDNGRSKSVKDDIAKCLMPKEYTDKKKD
jgi:Putative regulator of cell autolysis